MAGSVSQAVSSAVSGRNCQIPLGYYDDGSPCIVDIGASVNPHILIVGMSGAGKTHLIKHFCRRLQASEMTVMAVDGQGDLNDIPALNDLQMGYDGARTAINAMRVDPDRDGGGVSMAVRQVLHVIRMFSRSLGGRQEADLRCLLEETYRLGGIVQENPATWSEPSPTFRELLGVTSELLKKLSTGFSGDVYDVIKRYEQQLERAREAGDEQAIARAREELDATLGQLKVRNDSSFVTGRRWDAKRLESIEHVLHGIVATGLFNGDEIRIRQRMVNRFVFTKLHQIDQQILFYLILQRVFDVAQRSCRTLNPSMPSTYIVLDEGKHAAARMDDVMSPLNRIATEGRKFGLGMLMGVQSPNHLTDDAMECFATQVLLKMNHGSHEKVSRTFKVSETLLQNMEAKREALVSVNGSRFQHIAIDLEYR